MTTEFGDCPPHQFVLDSNHNWDKSMNKIVEELGKQNGIKKKYSKIDQYLARHSKFNVAYLSSPPPSLCIKIITPFSNSMISTNQETGL